MFEIDVVGADYAKPEHAHAVVSLLDAYASDPVGGGVPLSAYARENLVSELGARAHAFSVLAFAGLRPVGLINCIEGFSTFACRPLVNVHDVVVLPDWRGRGVGGAMLAFVEEQARVRGACKLTLEVLSGNVSACSLYERFGFRSYQLDPALGTARFMHKWLD
mgnify:CR=1 FL=1